MIKWRLYQDMRVSEGVDSRSLYSIALEQARWCDERGLTELWASEHHGHEEIASPLAFCAAVGAVTKRARLMVGAVLLPLHDPVRLAEDIILADLVSDGRMEVIMGLGYAQHEYDMFGTSAATRGRDADARLPTLLACLEGRPFEYGERRGRVLPRSRQEPRPPVLIGGGVKASATRAARFGDGFAPNPVGNAQELYDFYHAECARLGRKPGPILVPNPPFFIHVTDDPERDWAIVGPHLLDEINLYGRWSAAAGGPSVGYDARFEPATDIAVAKASPQFAVVTPEQCVEIARSLPDGGRLCLKPLRIAPAIDAGWRSLELFVDKVLPHVELGAPEPAAVPQPLEAGRA